MDRQTEYQSGKVSIIVPCYKQAEFLGETLDSVLAQTYQNWECIVVNDGSPDNTEEVAKAYCEKDLRIKYLPQPNSGVAMARNNGIHASDGEFILPLDGDDKITPEYLEKAVAFLTSHPDVKVFFSQAMKFGKHNGPWIVPEYKWETIIWGNMIFNTAMYRRCDFDKTVGYNPNMVHGYEDWEFYLSLLDKDAKVHLDDSFMYLYRTKESSRAVSNHSLNNRIASHRQIVLNHPDIYAEYVPDLIMLHNDSLRLQQILASQSYRLGERIAKIYRKIRYRE